MKSFQDFLNAALNKGQNSASIVEESKDVESTDEKDESKTNHDELIEGLQEDIRREWQAMIHYARYAETIKGAEYLHMVEDFKAHAAEEANHAATLIKQLDFMGVEPTMEVKPCKVIAKTSDIIKFLLDEENESIERYTTRANQAKEANLQALAQELRKIIVEEQHHAIDLDAALEE